MSFSPDSTQSGPIVTLTITIANAGVLGQNPATLTEISFVDALPALLQAADSQSNPSCGGATVQVGYHRITLSGATLGPKESCSLSLPIYTFSAMPEVANNKITVISNASPVKASATLTILPPNPPQVTMNFDPPTISVGGTSKLTFDVANPKSAIGTIRNLRFTDVLPAGVVIATPSNETGVCKHDTGEVPPYTPDGGNMILMREGDYAPNTSCHFSVDVTAAAAGEYQNQIMVESNTSPVTDTATLTVTPNGVFLDKCFCKDAPRLKDRETKLEGIKTLLINKLQATPASVPASQQEWAVVQSQIKGYLQVMIMQNLTTFPDTTLFNGNGDPFCGIQMISAGECLDQDYAQHQKVHDASCRAGNWSWQTQRPDSIMLQEEVAALQVEIDAIKETLKHLGCGAATSAVPSNQSCPQFMVVVQNQTTTSINMPGMTEQSGRSLDNGQGINIPLVFHPDGTFEGFGSGADSGSAAGAIPGETVRSQFGHMQAVAASGFVRPGDCRTKPCQPDVMHLVLVGGPSEQMTQGQARGTYNGNMQQTTPTGGARLEFDLPAYIGASAQKTFFSSPILNSGMTVNLVQGNNGTQALPAGSSLLYSLQQCKVNPPGVRVAGGTAGIVIPGLEDGSKINLNVNETIHTADATPVNTSVVLQVNETIKTTDVFGPTNTTHVAVTIPENIQAIDGVVPQPGLNHAVVTVNENVQLNDGIPADENMPHQMATINETVTVTATPQP